MILNDTESGILYAFRYSVDGSRGALWMNQSVPVPRCNSHFPPTYLDRSFYGISFHQFASLFSYAGQRALQDKHFRWRSQPHPGGANSFLVCPTKLSFSSNQGTRPWSSGDGGLTWSKLSAFLLAVDKHSNAEGQLERAACLPCAGALDTSSETIWCVQFVRGLGAAPQRFWLCLDAKAGEVVKDELITVSAAGHYNSGQVLKFEQCMSNNCSVHNILIFKLEVNFSIHESFQFTKDNTLLLR